MEPQIQTDERPEFASLRRRRTPLYVLRLALVLLGAVTVVAGISILVTGMVPTC